MRRYDPKQAAGKRRDKQNFNMRSQVCQAKSITRLACRCAGGLGVFAIEPGLRN
jgi:hypothetical protein